VLAKEIVKRPRAVFDPSFTKRKLDRYEQRLSVAFQNADPVLILGDPQHSVEIT
jgi:hypothetical protein